MLNRMLLRLGALVGAAGLFALAGAPVAQANSAFGVQNPGLPVSVSMTSAGANPEQATLGDKVAVVVVVPNAGTRTNRVNVGAVLSYPSGRQQILFKQVVLATSQPYVFFNVYTIDKTFENGKYKLTVQAGDASNLISTATATMTVSY